MKRVHMYSMFTGKYLRSYDKISDAAKVHGVTASAIGICAHGKRTQTSAGYRWSFEKHDVIPIKKVRYGAKFKPVWRINPYTRERVWYPSLANAADVNLSHRQNISKAIHKGITHLGYLWTFANKV